MASTGKHICITGISGFTGRHLACRLLAHGWQVSGIGPHEVPGTAFHLDVDIADKSRIATWLGDVQPSHVIHLAALSHVVGEPLPFYRVNVLGTESVIEAVSEAVPSISKLVIASSANVYGNAETLPISETAPVRPVNHYAISKSAAEMIAFKWCDRLPIIIARPFNYTGPGQSESFVFAKIAAAFRRREPRIRLGNTDVVRDLSDVSVICDAYEKLLMSPARSSVFNICSGRATSLEDAIDILREMTGHSPVIEVDQALIRHDEIKCLIGDPTQLFATVGPTVPVPLRDTFSAMLTN